MQDVHYSYGGMGPVMRYAGPPVFVLMALLFAFLAYVAIANFHKMEPPYEAAFIPLLSLLVIPMCLAGAYMIVKHGPSLSCEYLVRQETMHVLKDSHELFRFQLPDADIRYRMLARVFVITPPHDHRRTLVIMNNGRYETAPFLEIKTRLLSLPNTRKGLW